MVRSWSLAVAAVLLSGGVSWAGPGYREDLRHRPRLSFDGRDAAHIQRTLARVEAQEEPWRSSYQSLRSQASKGQGELVDWRTSGWASKGDPYVGLYSGEVKNAHIARSKAAVAWLYLAYGFEPSWAPLPRLPGESDPRGWCRAQAAEALGILQRMYQDWPCHKGFKVINRGIVAAEALQLSAGAYDLLLALPQADRPSERELDRAADAIAELASDFRFWLFTVDPQNSNHGVRVAAGLGAAALALNRYDAYRWTKPGTYYKRPKGWMDRALEELDPARKSSDIAKLTSTGAFAEGSSYYHYAMTLAHPFYAAHDRFHSNQGRRLLTDPRTVRVTRWLVELRLPNGQRPAIDNSNMFKDETVAYFANPSLVSQAALRRDLQWDWTQAGYPGAAGRRDLELLSCFDPSPADLSAVAGMSGLSGSPTRILPEEGQAALRTGWGADDAVAVVNAEHGEARSHGTGHESVDNGAYTFYAQGDLITIPPGYPGFSEVTKVNRGEHQSIILVDGEAPKPAKKPWYWKWMARGEDAFIRSGARTVDEPGFRSVEVTTRYEKTDIRRTFALVGERYLVIEDRASSSRSREITSQVHVNAGPTRGRPVAIRGAVASFETHQRGRAVCIGAAASAPLSLATREMYDAVAGANTGHTALDFRASGRAVTILTAIAVAAPGEAAPQVRPLAVSAVGAAALLVEVGGRVELVISNPEGQTVVVPAEGGRPRVESTHALAVVEVTSGQAQVVAALGAGQVR